jgi:hypothetical protein
MSDTTIILEMMNDIIKDDHPSIYQYVKGKSRSKENAIMLVTRILAPIFQGVYDINEVKLVVKEFFKQKEIEFMSGRLTINSIY